MTRPGISFAVQQCAHICNDPKVSHEKAVKHICRYLLKARDQGQLLKPDKLRGLECYVNADWDGSWTQKSSHDPKSARSRTGFVIMFAGCPIVWKIIMQTLTVL